MNEKKNRIMLGWEKSLSRWVLKDVIFWEGENFSEKKINFFDWSYDHESWCARNFIAWRYAAFSKEVARVQICAHAPRAEI